MKDFTSRILFLLKSALEASEEKGKFIEYLKLSEYFHFETENTLFTEKVNNLEKSISQTCKLILKEFENEKVD